MLKVWETWAEAGGILELAGKTRDWWQKIDEGIINTQLNHHSYLAVVLGTEAFIVVCSETCYIKPFLVSFTKSLGNCIM